MRRSRAGLRSRLDKEDNRCLSAAYGAAAARTPLVVPVGAGSTLVSADRRPAADGGDHDGYGPSGDRLPGAAEGRSTL